MGGLSKMTLDVIGLAGTAYGYIHLPYTVMLTRVKGFNYDIDSLNTEKPPNELSVAFQEIFKSPPRLNVVELLRNLIPGLRHVVSIRPSPLPRTPLAVYSRRSSSIITA